MGNPSRTDLVIQPSLCRNFFSFGEHLLVKFYFISQHEANHILFTLYTLLIYSTHTQRYSYQSYIYHRFIIDGLIFNHTHTLGSLPRLTLSYSLLSVTFTSNFGSTHTCSC